MNTPQERPFVDVRNLRVTFTGGKTPVEAVNGVDLRFWHFTKLGAVGDAMTRRYAGRAGHWF